MNVKLKRSYRSKNGNATFVYEVTGKSTDLDAYKTAQADYYRESEDGVPLWFTTRCIGKSGTLIITTNGNIVPDMSAFDQMASLAEQYGGNFGTALADKASQMLLGFSTQSNPEQDVPKAKPASETKDEPEEVESKEEDVVEEDL
jgi:hypothetical protein